MEEEPQAGLQEGLGAAMAGPEVMTATDSEEPAVAEMMILGVEGTSMIGHDSGEVTTAAAPEEMAAAVEGFEETTMAGAPIGRRSNEMMTAGAEIVMLGVVAIGSVAAMTVGSLETVSDSSHPVPAPNLQAPPMGHVYVPVADQGIIRVIQGSSPQVLSTAYVLLGTTCCL